MTMYNFVEDCEYWGYDDVQLGNKSDGIFGCFLATKEDKESMLKSNCGIYLLSY